MATVTLAGDRETFDLTACDREPIHVPGSIQPHGLLLIARADDRVVVAGAGAVERLFGDAWQGRALDDLLAQDVGVLLAAHPLLPGENVAGQPVAGYDVTIHVAGERLLVELEPEGESFAAGGILTWLDGVTASFERATTLAALCARAAAAFRLLTGYDRVMVYRFLDDEAGRVIAEDRTEGYETFLHHHFPASDIPRQARALYVRNRTRVIPDVAYAPAPIRPADYADTDLTDVSLRSVSPIHVQYLRNMEVGASASISIVADGALWGLIACHHAGPRTLSRTVRGVAAALAGSMAREIKAREEAETYRARLNLRAAQDAIVPSLAADEPIERVVERRADDWRRMFDADGVAIVRAGRVHAFGVVPEAGAIRRLARWIDARETRLPFHTDSLMTRWPEGAEITATASGVLAFEVPEEQAMLLWFRTEQVEEVEWAGNPHKDAADPVAILTPRTSFATWTEAVHGRARRWTLEEVESAHRLQRVIGEAHRTRELARLNRELERSLADKDMLMKEVDHRVQNSLQLVAAFLSLQARQAGAGAVADQLNEARSRLSAVALVHRRLYRDDQIEAIDLSRYITELLDDLKSSLGADWGRHITATLAPVLCPTDRAVSVGLIVAELVINATKYAYAGAPGPIEIVLEQQRNKLRLIVADQGRGAGAVPNAGGGFGSRMMDAVLAKLDGEIERSDNLPGMRVVLTAPIGEPGPRKG